MKRDDTIIDEIVDQVVHRAEWRRSQADRFPNDARRNQAAAERLDRIAEDLPRLEGSSLEHRLEAWARSDSDSDVEQFTMILDEQVRQVGFSFSPNNADEFLEGVLGALTGASQSS